MKTISKELEDYIAHIANIVSSDIPDDDEGNVYVSKFDGSYLTRVGNEEALQWMLNVGISESIQSPHKCACIGFSPSQNRWYGWSHRATYGFTIGDTCKKGDCHYNGTNVKEQEADAILFWECECYENVRCEGIIEENGEKFFDIAWEYLSTTPNKSLHGTSGRVTHHIKALGKGEWVAETMEDAYQMACDFAESVS